MIDWTRPIETIDGKPARVLCSDWTRPIETIDGKPARVLCTDAKGELPVIVLVREGDKEFVYRVCLSGANLYNTLIIRNKPLVDWSKPIQTRSRLPARVLHVGLKNDPYTVVVGVTYGKEQAQTYTIDGYFIEGTPNHEMNIINIGE